MTRTKMTRFKLAPALFMLALIYLVGGDGSASASAAAIQGNKCQRDEQCSEGQFCWPISHHCVPCRNCGKLQRMPPRQSACARTMNECGPCMPGFRDSGNHCLQTTTEETPNVKMETSSPLSMNKNKSSDNFIISEGFSIPTWLVVVIVFIVLVPFCGLGLTYYRRRKQDNVGNQSVSYNVKRKDSEKEGLRTSLIRNFESGPGDQNASAPPEEYLRSPPPFNEKYKNHYVHQTYHSNSKKNLLEDSRKQRAVPFDLGNGSGDWANNMQAPVNVLVEQMDMLDANPPSPDQGNGAEPEAPVDNAMDVENNIVGEVAALQANDLPQGIAVGMEQNPNGEHGRQQQQGGGLIFELRLGFRGQFNPTTNSNTLSHSPRWMSTSQLDVANPSTSQESIDSGVVSSSGDSPNTTRQVPDITQPREEDVVMEEELEA